MEFTCPVCGERLLRQEKVFLCPKGHSYDRAKEGYVHLLPPNRMHSKAPGDTKEMVAARRAFLEAGYYAPFRDALKALCLEAVKRAPSPALFLDAGCGEGYYTGGVLEAFRKTRTAASFYGFDISKCAVRAAAKANPAVCFAVASMFAIPMATACADVVTDIFAPIVPEELARVIRPGGTLILAVPTPRHLYGLKEILYDAPYENEQKDTEYPGFTFVKRQTVEGEITLNDPGMIQNLFSMTPYYWKTPVEGCERLRQTNMLQTEIGFDFLVYRRNQTDGKAEG